MDGMFRFGGFWRFRLGLASCGSVRYGGRGSGRFGRVGCGQSRRTRWEIMRISHQFKLNWRVKWKIELIQFGIKMNVRR